MLFYYLIINQPFFTANGVNWYSRLFCYIHHVRAVHTHRLALRNMYINIIRAAKPLAVKGLKLPAPFGVKFYYHNEL